LKQWPNSDVVDAVLRFGEGASPGDALWALYMAAEKLDLPELWTTVGRAIRPFSLLMSVACFERAGAAADAIENEFYPVSVDNLIKERRRAVPRSPPIAAASPPATAKPATVLLAESPRPVRVKPQVNPNPEDSLGQPDAPTPAVQRRNRALKMIGAMAVVLILVGGVWTWNQHQAQKARLAPAVGRVLETRGATTPSTPAYCSMTGASLSCRLESGRTLWDIAVECYGDGGRSREIWHINHERFPGRTVRQIPDDSLIEMVGACTARAS
jgi:nucleoid-associated protein YgaU